MTILQFVNILLTCCPAVYHNEAFKEKSEYIVWQEIGVRPWYADNTRNEEPRLIAVDFLTKWEEETKLRHVDTGEMLKNIKSSRVKTNKYGKFTVTYPMGSERRIRRGKEVEVRHAEKAFYQHYGYFNVLTGKFHRGDRWVEIVEIKAEPAAERVMQTIWDKYLQEKQK